MKNLVISLCLFSLAGLVAFHGSDYFPIRALGVSTNFTVGCIHAYRWWKGLEW